MGPCKTCGQRMPAAPAGKVQTSTPAQRPAHRPVVMSKPNPFGKK